MFQRLTACELMTRYQITKRVANGVGMALVALQLGTLVGCDKKPEVSANRRRFDSLLANRDTSLLRIRREQDSMMTLLAGQKQDSTKPSAAGAETNASTTAVASAVTPSAASKTSGATVPATASSKAAAPPPAARNSGKTRAIDTSSASLPLDGIDKSVINPRATSAQNIRAMALGDSIASARANKRLGISTSAGGSGDTLRGIVEMQGTPPAARAALRTDGGRKLVALTGLAGEGLASLAGAEVMVRGIKVSTLDVVVTTFSVRSIRGAPAVDGKLHSEAGAWTLELSDKSGVKKLNGVPKDMQLAEGNRVWIIFAPGTNTPKTFGTIAGR